MKKVKDLYELVLFALQFIVLLVWTIVKLPFPTPRKCITDQIALITGAGRGLGREIAFVLAEHGCKLVLVDINLSEAEQTAQDVTLQTGRSARAYKCDVSNFKEVEALQEKVKADVGIVDILVNNAGLILFQSFVENSERDIQKVIDVNVNGVIWMTKVFLEDMLGQKRGHILTISSAQAIFTVPWSVVYATSKAASHMFMTALAEQLRLTDQDNFVCTSSVLPYVISTAPTTNFKYTFSFLDPRETAKVVVDGLVQNKRAIFVPPSWSVLLKMYSILPVSLQHLVRDVLMKEKHHYHSQSNQINTVYQQAGSTSQGI